MLLSAALIPCWLMLFVSNESMVAEAFTIRASPRQPTTRLFLKDWVADMIDSELDRQNHLKEFEDEWMKKNRGAILHHMNNDVDNENLMMESSPEDFRMHAKDVKMAKEQPEKYCADRCVTTGNCDVFEDFFEMSPEEVLSFCNDCVLSDGDEPCDVPDGFYDHQLHP